MNTHLKVKLRFVHSPVKVPQMNTKTKKNFSDNRNSLHREKWGWEFHDRPGEGILEKGKVSVAASISNISSPVRKFLKCVYVF